RNLFEVPVLFFAVCLTILNLDLVTSVQLGLAWTFVSLRCLHSFIQLTSNTVMHRFRVYVLGTLCIFAMWAMLAFQL
ncbi:MAG: MAPEG family protein, partial [Gammaproteobacteria bacterium]